MTYHVQLRLLLSNVIIKHTHLKDYVEAVDDILLSKLRENSTQNLTLE